MVLHELRVSLSFEFLLRGLVSVVCIRVCIGSLLCKRVTELPDENACIMLYVCCMHKYAYKGPMHYNSLTQRNADDQ